MKIGIASDHAGYILKKEIIEKFKSINTSVLDLGADSEVSSDYPDFAGKIGDAILGNKIERGILICGSGVGICIAANKIKGIYAGICHDTYSAHQGVEHDNMNVVCLGADIIGFELAWEIIKSFLAAKYTGQEKGQERHARRVEKVKQLEKKSLS